jgi:hypothetical protein
MAAGEVYLKSSNPDRIFFRNSSNVEISVTGSTVAATAAAGEVYIRIVSGIPYFYWSVNGSTVYRTPTADFGNSAEAIGSLWVSSGATNRLNVAVNNTSGVRRAWGIPVPPPPTTSPPPPTTSPPPPPPPTTEPPPPPPPTTEPPPPTPTDPRCVPGSRCSNVNQGCDNFSGFSYCVGEDFEPCIIC